MSLPLFQEIEAARDRLKGRAHVTPIATSRSLNELARAEVFCKCESLQRVGAFKFRGAFNAISKLTAAEKKAGVVAYSSGNHAQAVALVASLLGVQATLVMPADSSPGKRAATAAYGGKVVLVDTEKLPREQVARELQERHGYVLIPPFDHLDVIAGQGTAALEMFGQVKSLDWLIVPCGGGGLLSGSAVAAKEINPDCRIVGIEPELADDAVRSFRTKTLQTVKNPPTMADGARTPSLGQHTFPLVLKYVDQMTTVSEQAIAEAVRFLFYRMKLVVEPSGALPIAALLSGAVRPQGRAGVILSGGNIDGEVMARILRHEPMASR
jgi:threonine dehydratase